MTNGHSYETGGGAAATEQKPVTPQTSDPGTKRTVKRTTTPSTAEVDRKPAPRN
ncbi:MAG: hypothetical protein AB7F89_03115 [Pirellulaceae bacterium]